MECKFTLEDTFGSDFNELIETLWNVNDSDHATEDDGTDELIETLWNVNLVKGCRVVQW